MFKNFIKIMMMMVPLTACKLSPVSNLYMEDEVVVEKESYGATQNKSLNLQVPCDNGDIFQNGICINKDLPLSPSIRRFLGKAGERETFPNLIKISGVTDRYDAQKPEHLYKVLPYWRSSIDARLYVGAANNWTNFPQGFPNSIPNMGGQAVMLGYVDPENFDYDNKINNTNPFITSSAIHPIVYLTYHLAHTKLNFKVFKNNQAPGTYHMDFCHDKYFEDNSNPRKCQAYQDATASSVFTGDCYDVTLLTFSEQNNKHEVRTVPLTIFIKNAKVSGANEEIVIYPRKELGILSNYQEMRNLANIGDPQNGSISNIKFLTDQCVDTNGAYKANAPFYCEFVSKQRRVSSIKVNGVTKFYPNGPPFFEPSISGDGRLLFVNFGLGLGLHYSYNVQGSCSASGWTDFYPISKMPFDKNIYENYPIGRAQRRKATSPLGTLQNYSVPFKDGVGDDIPENRPVEGAYMWVDRKVRNIFFNAVNVIQDNFKGEKTSECLALDPECVLDRSPGKGLHMLGVWTKGRAIHLDSVVNMFDFGSRPYRLSPSEQKVFQMKLYKNEITTLRPSAMTVIGSPENHFNEYDALVPTAPFDIVWKFSSNNERTGEIIFDDYLNQFLFLGTHFIQSTQQKQSSNGYVTVFKNGYVSQNNNFSTEALTRGDFQLREIPLLQNISGNYQMVDGSTSDYNFELLGGARVEPVAMGGVIGRGVYLDGSNDSAAISSYVQRSGSTWLLSLWLDPRTLDQQERVIFGFPDYSSIAITNQHFVAKSCNEVGVCFSKKISHKNTNIGVGKYFHLTVKIESLPNPKTNPSLQSFNNLRRLTFYVDGTQLIEKVIYKGYSYKLKYLDFGFNDYNKQKFDFYNNHERGIFSVGRQNLSDQEKSFHGWVDELRVYKFGAFYNDPYPQMPIYFREVLCNQALGSMVEVLATDANSTDLLSYYRKADLWGHWANRPSDFIKSPPKYLPINNDFVLEQYVYVTQICEQLKLTSYDSHGEFADQRDNQNLICADKVHANPHPELGHRCLHKKIFEIHNKPLKAGMPRPSFDSVPFCLSCHRSSSLTPELSKTALIPLAINREDDLRRQPLDVTRKNNGCVPTDTVFGVDAGDCKEQGMLLDFIFDFNPKIPPK